MPRRFLYALSFVLYIVANFILDYLDLCGHASFTTRSLAVFNEALRMFAPVSGIPKVAAGDPSLVTSNIHGEKTTVPVPKGTNITIDTPGIRYNPSSYWPRDTFKILLCVLVLEPVHAFRRKFAEAEATAVLSILVSQFKMPIKEELHFTAETFEERKRRILSARVGLTMTPVRVPLVFTHRS